MSTTKETKAKPVDVKLEVQIIPVSDVDRSKKFYQGLGWRLDDDVAPLDGLRNAAPRQDLTSLAQNILCKAIP